MRDGETETQQHTDEVLWRRMLNVVKMERDREKEVALEKRNGARGRSAGEEIGGKKSRDVRTDKGVFNVRLNRVEVLQLLCFPSKLPLTCRLPSEKHTNQHTLTKSSKRITLDKTFHLSYDCFCFRPHPFKRII